MFYFISPVLTFYLITFLLTLGFALYLSFAAGFDLSSAGSAQLLEDLTVKYTFELETILYAVLLAVQLPGFLKNERKRFDYMYKSSLRFRDVLFAAVAGIGLYLAIDVVLVIIDGLFGLERILTEHSETVSAMLTDSLWKDLLLFVILSPAAEEIMMRGLMFNRLRLVADEKRALFISAAAFAVMHYASLLQICYAFVMGLVITYAYTKYENILVPVFIHASFNLMNYVTEIPFISQGLETKAGLLIYYFLAVGLFTVSIRYLRAKSKPEAKKFRLVRKSDIK